MKKVAIYARVSSDAQVKEGYSLDAQERVGVKYCKEKKLDYEVFSEAGESAYKESIEHRPQLLKILDLIDDGKIAYLFVTELDRLSRNELVAYNIKKVLRENNVKVLTPTQTYDFTDDTTELFASIEGAIAVFENRRRIKRVKRAKEEAMLRGNWALGGVVAYGYKIENKRLIINPKEADIYKMMVQLSLDGKGTYQIANRLNSMSIPTKKTLNGKFYTWKDRVVWRILSNPIYNGKFHFKGHKINVPQLITEEQWELLQEKLKLKKMNAIRSTKHFYLVRGLLKCKRCGRNLFGRRKPKNKENIYRCLSHKLGYEKCGLKSINIDRIEKLVWEETKNLVINSERLKDVLKIQLESAFVESVQIETDLNQVEKSIRSKDDEIKDLIRKRGKYSNISDDEIDSIIKEIKSEKEHLLIAQNELTEKLNKINLARRKSNNIADYLLRLGSSIDNFTDQEKSDFLHAVIDRVEIEYDEIIKDHTVEIIYAIPLTENELTPNVCYSFLNFNPHLSDSRHI